MLLNTRNFLAAVLFAPVLFTGCVEDAEDALGLGYTAHYAQAAGSLNIDSTDIYTKSNIKVYADDDIYDQIEGELDTADHIILTDYSDTDHDLTIHLSSNCQSIQSFSYTDTSTGTTYNDASNVTYSCTKDDTAVYEAGDLGLTDNWDYKVTTYSIAFGGSLTNATNDTVQLADRNITMYEVYYDYDLF